MDESVKIILQENKYLMKDYKKKLDLLRGSL